MSAAASARTAAGPNIPALAAVSSESLLVHTSFSSGLQHPQPASSSSSADDEEEWRRMPGVPTDAERARTNAEEVFQRGEGTVEGGDGTEDDSKTEPEVPQRTVPPQAESAHAAAAIDPLAGLSQPSVAAAAFFVSTAEAELLEQQAMLQQQQAVLRVQMAAVEAKLAALRAGTAD
jgi:hypothetical protein